MPSWNATRANRGTGIRRHVFSVEDSIAPRILKLFSPSETCVRDHEALQANS
jgi:hypothetical protein